MREARFKRTKCTINNQEHTLRLGDANQLREIYDVEHTKKEEITSE